MDFELNEEQRLLQQTIREFAWTRIQPGAAERDEAARFPRELIPEMAKLGLFGVMVPENYGGAGLDTLSLVIIIEEVARVDGSLALIVASHNSLCNGHIYTFGSDDQKKRYLPSLAQGKSLGGWALTEPESGSDAAAAITASTADHGTRAAMNRSTSSSVGHAGMRTVALPQRPWMSRTVSSSL